MVETDYTLQQFSGRFGKGGTPTDYPDSSEPASYPIFANVFRFDTTPPQHFDMGGCMGCHGNAQVAGADFSFVLLGGANNEPEFPVASGQTLAKVPEKYRKLLRF